MRMNRGFIYIFFFLVSHIGLAQEWTLKLTSKIEKDGKGIAGASIILYKGSSIITQTQSSGNGDFQINVPANGDYIMTVSYPGCNTKKFQVSTMGVPADLINDKFKAEVKIEGVTMSKPLPGINYSVLNQPLLKLGYNASKKTFNDDPSYTNQTLNALASIRAQEEELITKYNAALKSGDSFLAKKDCDNAKAQYTTANKILPDEGTPLEKLLLAENCIKAKADEEAKKKAEAEAAAKKAEEERLAKEKEAAAKAEAERIAQEKAAAEKLAKEQAAAKKAEEERLAKEKEAAAKAEAERIAQEKAAAEKLAKEQAAAKKAEEERLAKEKEAAAKAEAERIAQEKAAAEKLAKEQEAAKKAEEERLAKEKEAAAKAEAER
ncbi:MAG: carboxypeptidase regulatory-like domain-containing protein, partial [Bacteroidia bacterium]|nr:carboxypeptidase regulatory-like domain-containing protein [Bacteroidia bacterium]